MDQIVANRIAKELIGQEVGGWQIISTLNSGKSAVVFKASRLGESAAVKIFDPEMVERYGKNTQLARIGRELTLRGKHHPNLVRILDGGECSQSGHLFVAMELLESPNLASVISTVPRDRIWPLISQIASAARFLEGLELVHRDIKPENIAITSDFDATVLLDLGVLRPFGVAGLTDEEQRTFVGTLQYSPPEFLVRQEEDTPEGWRAITFYQLGAVLHDLIMRKRIFAEYIEPYALLGRAVERVTPKVHAADVPADLIVLAASCLQKDPKLRLTLVSWEDFDPPQFRGDPMDDPKTRIRRRRAIAQQSAVAIDADVEQRSRSARRTLDKLQAALQSEIHQECIASELFPQLEIHDAQPPSSSSARFRVHFASSADHALAEVLSLFFTIELLDENSEAVTISYAGAISPAGLDWESAEQHNFCCLFKGVFNQVAVGDRLRQTLYRILDRAQQTNRVEQDLELNQPIWLEAEAPDSDKETE
jgi:serine/threonine protein kinase